MRFDQQTEPTAFIPIATKEKRNWKEEQMQAEKKEQELLDEMFDEDEKEEQ